MKKYMIFFLILLLIPTVFAFETTQECLNSTHIQWMLKWNECDGSCEDKNLTQLVNCTSGCDTINNICRYTEKSNLADVVGFSAVSLCGFGFLFMGLRMESGDPLVGIKEVFFRSGLKLLFIMFGMWLFLLSMGTATTVVESSGASQGTISQVGTALTVMTYGVYLFMFIYMIAFLYTILMILAESTKRGRR